MQDRLEMLALEILGTLVRLLPPRAARRVARGLGRFAWRVGVRRRVTDDNIDRALGNYEARQRQHISRDCFEALAVTAVEFLRLTPKTVRQSEMQVEFHGWEHFLEAQRQGKGAIIAGAHMGNWELHGAAAVARGMDVTFVVQRLRNRAADRALNDRRRAVGIHVMERGMAMRRLAECLERNHLVAIMCDQDARHRGVFVPFFGRLASTHKGAAQLAYRHGVPLIPSLGYRKDDGTHVVHLHPPLQGPAGGEESEFVQTTMEQFHVLLEEAVRGHPGQYLWQHRRWKTAPPGEAADRLRHVSTGPAVIPPAAALPRQGQDVLPSGRGGEPSG